LDNRFEIVAQADAFDNPAGEQRRGNPLSALKNLPKGSALRAPHARGQRAGK
jgi:hypothetical protein